jgi:acyl dehydratase
LTRWFEDIAVGERAAFGQYQVTREAVLDFARAFDPQPFHLSDEAAAQSLFGRIAASGWHSCAMTMAMLVAHWQAEGLASVGGAGVDELRWLKPVYPGDTLRCETEVLEVRAPARNPERGSVKLRIIVFNQADEAVMHLVTIGLFATRPAAS